MKTFLKFTALSAVLLMLAGSLVSCRETKEETLQILIQNETKYTIYVTLFPIGGGTSYLQCVDCGEGGGRRNAEFNLHSRNTEVFLMALDVNIRPYTLVSKAFDSIHIMLGNKDSAMIKLTPEEVVGFSENIFSENTIWYLEKVKGDPLPGLQRGSSWLHRYSFVISEDRIIINQQNR